VEKDSDAKIISHLLDPKEPKLGIC